MGLGVTVPAVSGGSISYPVKRPTGNSTHPQSGCAPSFQGVDRRQDDAMTQVTRLPGVGVTANSRSYQGCLRVAAPSPHFLSFLTPLARLLLIMGHHSRSRVPE